MSETPSPQQSQRPQHPKFPQVSPSSVTINSFTDNKGVAVPSLQQLPIPFLVVSTVNPAGVPLYGRLFDSTSKQLVYGTASVASDGLTGNCTITFNPDPTLLTLTDTFTVKIIYQDNVNGDDAADRRDNLKFATRVSNAPAATSQQESSPATSCSTGKS